MVSIYCTFYRKSIDLYITKIQHTYFQRTKDSSLQQEQAFKGELQPGITDVN